MEKVNIQKQLDSFANKQLPLWDDFPDFELYMDQLVSLGNRYLEGLIESPLTPSMVNSYVKKGLMSRPQKKKYTNTHLAELIAISLLKAIYPLDVIANYLDELLHEFSIKESYNSFATIFNDSLKNSCQVNFATDLTTLSQTTITKHIVIKAMIYKMIGEQLIKKAPATSAKTTTQKKI